MNDIEQDEMAILKDIIDAARVYRKELEEDDGRNGEDQQTLLRRKLRRTLCAWLDDYAVCPMVEM